MAAKRKTGRPSKYRPEMCERVVELMKLGKSQVEVCAELDIGTTTLERWIKEHEAFRGAIKRGTDFSEAEWVKLGHQLATGEKAGNVTAWIFNMKNRFGWRDQKQLEHTGKDAGPIILDWTPLTGGGEDMDLDDE